MNYIERICDSELQDKLDAFGAVHVIGPKWCGKTTTAKQFAKSYIEMQDPDMREFPKKRILHVQVVDVFSRKRAR